MRLSLLMITKNSGSLLGPALESVKGLVDEAVIVDGGSTDDTEDVAQKSGARMYPWSGRDLGAQRAYGLERCRGDWVLMLDADERISAELREEIRQILGKDTGFNGYRIPYRNHFLGRPIRSGGESYRIMRLFKRSCASIPPEPVHEHVRVKGKTGELHNVIHHYSYRSIPQMFAKFTDYAHREAQRKRKNGEHAGILKLVTYPVHMFYARYIKDKGYRDHISRIILDLGFAYMEFLTYLLLLLQKSEHEKA
jgi:glycosyltransferase involved in cell wall biosynthesis